MPNPSPIASLNRGSTWHRWDPHIHAPGTLLNDQFRGANAWHDYLTLLEGSDPPIRALGVTDYYVTDTYSRVLSEKESGRIPAVELIFPNVELRLDVGTPSGGWVNVHLLVSPEDPDHLQHLHQFLSRLRFRAYGESFSCTKADLIRLGGRADSTINDERAALRHGAGQFKVDFGELRAAREQSDWALSDILIAVAGGKSDGTSGMRGAADTTLREEIEKFADIIFASSHAQREYWLGQRPSMSADAIRQRYRGLKPCLHGSDAHERSKVGKPDEDRFCWVKGEPTFDTLRQACIDPAGRAFVGLTPPETTTPSQIIDHIAISAASWAKTPQLGFNSGLIAIIGPRGSGKTALAEMIARACDAIPESDDGSSFQKVSSSFIDRAGDLLGSASVELEWGAGERISRRLDGANTPDRPSPRARYLSQQFVDSLCSSDSMSDALLKEIERVVFEAHPQTERGGALTFPELLDARATRFRLARAREEEAIVNLSARIGDELNKIPSIGPLTEQVSEKKRLIAAYTADRERLVSKGSEDRLRKLTEVTKAAETVRGYLRYFTNQEQALLALQDEVSDLRENKAPELLRRTQERHSSAQLKPRDWEAFRLDYTGDVDSQLATYLQSCRKAIKDWRGTTPSPIDGTGAFVAPTTTLNEQSLATLDAEIERLGKLVSADQLTQKRFVSLSEKIRNETSAEQLLEKKLKDAKGARSRATKLQTEREAAYSRVFDALTSEQEVLVELYRPLLARLSQASNALTKMTLTVSRSADVERWAGYAETHLLDLRLQGPFRGKGKLQEITEQTLKTAWETGDAQDVSRAMADFRRRCQNDLLRHASVSNSEPAHYRVWLKRFAHWLFSTDHIRLSYSLDYGGVDIRKLSPGNRGIVLLLLYLALDDADDRAAHC